MGSGFIPASTVHWKALTVCSKVMPFRISLRTFCAPGFDTVPHGFATCLSHFLQQFFGYHVNSVSATQLTLRFRLIISSHKSAVNFWSTVKAASRGERCCAKGFLAFFKFVANIPDAALAEFCPCIRTSMQKTHNTSIAACNDVNIILPYFDVALIAVGRELEREGSSRFSM